MIKKSVKSSIIHYFYIILLSVLFLLIYSPVTSPLTKYYGFDSASFILVGKGMTEGMLPYRDFFDMKGPYFYLIQYLGQLIYPGRTGAFIMQCINLFISLCIIDKIFQPDQHTNEKIAGVAQIIRLMPLLPCLYIATFTFGCGNLTEEFSLPLLLLPLFCAIQYLNKISTGSIQQEHPFKYGVLYGASFGMLAMIRITNAALIGAIVLTISIELIVHKKYKNFLYNALAFLTGTALVIIPIFIYFAMQGLLKEMINTVFLFGITYSSENSFMDKLQFTLKERFIHIFFMALPIVSLAVIKNKSWVFWLLSISSFIITLIATSMGFGYIHYFALGIPLVVLSIYHLKIYVNKIIKNAHHSDGHKLDWLKQLFSIRKSLWAIILIFAIQLPYAGFYSLYSIQKILDSENDKEKLEQIREIKNIIPEEEKVFAYALDSCSAFYIKTDTMPPIKYFDWQEHYLSLVPEIGEELTAKLSNGEIRWIITPDYYNGSSNVIDKAIEENYEIHLEQYGYRLYNYSPK